MSGLVEELEKIGLEVLGPECNNQNLEKEDISNWAPDPEVGAVVVGYDMNFNFKKLSFAHHYINEGAEFITSNPDMFGYLKNGQKEHVTGLTLSALKLSTGKDAHICGKPNPELFNLIMKEHNIPESEKSKFVMIGDKLETDIEMGTRAGIDTILCETGNHTRDDIWTSKNLHNSIPTGIIKAFSP
jgi:HAD superfamily hydrolase (TIGR01450 family)